MNAHHELASASEFVAARRQAASLKDRDEEKLWLYLRALNDFVRVTGQVYRFEDSLKATFPTDRSHVGLSAPKGTFAQRAVELLLNTLDEAPEPGQKQPILVLLSLLKFITDTGQLGDVEDFFIHQTEYAPVAIAYFTRHDEAESWLKGTAELPSPAHILIGDDYHQFWYMRDDNTRGMYRDPAIEPALEALTSQGIPPQTPSFATRADAESWLMSHPANPYAFVAIAGTYHLAVHHRRLKHHSLHPVASTLEAWEAHKKAVKQGE